MKIWLAIVVAIASLGSAEAQEPKYPTKPITIVATAASGGVVDLLARTLGKQLTRAWGQQVIVENKGGASNQIGAEFVAKSAPDGYTLMLTPEATFVINPSLYSKLTYDPVKDFVPVAGLVRINQALVAHPSLPAQSVKELIELARRKPGELNYGTFGVGSTGHLNMEMLQSMAGVKFVAVQYKGATPALTDVMAGHIQMMFINASSAVEPVRAGRLKMLAVGSRQRIAEFPDTPTVAENGLPGFEAVSWFGLFAPAGTPKDIVMKINAEVQRIFADPDVQQTFVRRNRFEAITGSPEQFDSFIKDEARKWKKVISDAKVKIN